MRHSVIYIAISIIIVFCSCGGRPSQVLSEDEMMEVLYDIRLVQAIYSSNTEFSSDSMKDVLVNGVLAKHNITQAQLDSSLVWYADNIEQYRIINDSITSRLRAESNFIMDQKSRMDSKFKADYLIPPFFYLTESTPILRFEIDSVKIKTIDIPSFHFTFDVQGLSPLLTVDAAVYFTYKDTLIWNKVDINKNIGYVFSKPQLADSLLKSISGYIRIDNRTAILSNVMLYNISYSDSVAVKNHAVNAADKEGSKFDRSDRIEKVQPEQIVEEQSLETTKLIDSTLKAKPVTK